MAVKKKVKLSKKGYIVFGILAAILVAVLGPIIYFEIEKNEIVSYGYSVEAIDNIKKYGLKDYVKEHKDNKTLDTALKSKEFKKDNLEVYERLDYQDQENFVLHINQLLEKGYVTEEINRILATGSDEDVSNFIEQDKFTNVLRYLKFDYAKLAYLDRYRTYQADNGTMDQDAVVRVNIGLDRPFYEDAVSIHDFSVDVLANKYRQLSENYIPDDLQEIPSEYCLNGKQLMARVARDAFVEMVEDASLEGVTMKARSSYRTYKEQEELYNEYKDLYGSKRADEIAARPGFSEHQTGLVIDIAESQTGVFANSDAFYWLQEHAYEYGFILRYPKGKENITGYSYESWHYRYVGKEIASYMHENNLTFDEYYVMFLDK